MLHSDRNLRERLAHQIAVEFGQTSPGKSNQVEWRDGAHLDHFELLHLLKGRFEAVLLDLHLPAMLALRAAELAHLACIPARMVLLVPCRQPGLRVNGNAHASKNSPDFTDALLKACSPLFDSCLQIPFDREEAVPRLCAVLEEPVNFQRGSLPNQDQLDAAIENLLSTCLKLAPGARGAAHAFGIYRDAYLQPDFTTWESRISLAQLNLEARLDRFIRIRPLLFSPRLIQAAERIARSPYFAADQHAFLKKRFDYLLDNTGRVLSRYRQEVEDILIGIEQFACMSEAGRRQEQMQVDDLAQMLIVRAKEVPGFEEGIAPLVYFLLRLHNVPLGSGLAA